MCLEDVTIRRRAESSFLLRNNSENKTGEYFLLVRFGVVCAGLYTGCKVGWQRYNRVMAILETTVGQLASSLIPTAVK